MVLKKVCQYIRRKFDFEGMEVRARVIGVFHTTRGVFPAEERVTIMKGITESGERKYFGIPGHEDIRRGDLAIYREGGTFAVDDKHTYRAAKCAIFIRDNNPPW